MALGLGLGLPFTAGRWAGIPQADSLLWWLDPRRIAATPVDSWPARVGSFSPTAAGGARPTWDGTSVTFDGTDDALTVATSAAIHPSGAAKFSVAAWVKPTSLSATSGIILETGTYPNSLQLQCASGVAATELYVGSLQARWPTALTAEVWAFVAATYDGSRSPGSRCRLFVGAPTVVEVSPALDNVNTATLPAASGTARIGGRTGGWYPGSVGDAFLWSGVELTSGELQQVVNATNY